MLEENPSTWVIIIVAILDFLLIFVGGGKVISLLSGESVEGGFKLKGLPALGLFALVFLYFWGMKKIGGTVFERLFGIS